MWSLKNILLQAQNLNESVTRLVADANMEQIKFIFILSLQKFSFRRVKFDSTSASGFRIMKSKTNYFFCA